MRVLEAAATWFVLACVCFAAPLAVPNVERAVAPRSLNPAESVLQARGAGLLVAGSVHIKASEAESA
ncbi:hypothetical protein PsYK624_050810 [Phanerochaete sordida]|uniref:Uncharacterized protein n=1 Tax=Phanerochaete sordida TaxID=48140 RepID=A0A9P3LCL2_9APHY|nr:hypothetical protein PsYK624_050810 [Phanerochaete sordida]